MVLFAVYSLCWHNRDPGDDKIPVKSSVGEYGMKKVIRHLHYEKVAYSSCLQFLLIEGK